MQAGVFSSSARKEQQTNQLCRTEEFHRPSRSRGLWPRTFSFGENLSSDEAANKTPRACAMNIWNSD